MKKLITAMAVLAVVVVAVPAMASDAPGYAITVGGRIKADMGWQILPGNDNDRQVMYNASDSTIANFFAAVNSNSYLRVLFTSADKTTGAHIEFGVSDITNQTNAGGVDAANGASVRFAYGWWKAGSCRLLVGHMAGRLGDRVNFIGQNLGHTKSFKADLAGFGFMAAGTRNPKIALQMDVNENFGFEVALGQAGAEITPGLNNANFPIPANVAISTNSYLPRLEAVFDIKFGGLLITPGFGISYINYAVNDVNYNGDDSTLSYILWLPVQYKTGPLTVFFNAYYGVNRYTDWTGEWGGSAAMQNNQFRGQPLGLPVLTADGGGEVEDTKEFGLGVAVNFAFTEQLSLNVGGGFTYMQNDGWARNYVNAAGNNAIDEDDSYVKWGAFIALPYKLTSNFTIAPEIGYYNYGDRVAASKTAGSRGRDISAGDEWILGVHFQFLF